MRVEVINTGSELLLGTTQNTHLAWLAQELFGLGLRIGWQATVPDGEAIRTALREALLRADLVLVTGGLGPTSDDLTRDFAAELFGRPLREDPDVLAAIRGYFDRRRVTLPANVARQAQVPEGAIVLANRRGTAPGLILEGALQEPAGGQGRKTAVLLPGPPRELQPMWLEVVRPWLAARLAAAGQPPLHEKTWRMLGVGESRVQEMLESRLLSLGPGLEIGYCARAGEVDLRLLAPSPAHLEQADQIVRQRLGASIYAEGTATLEEVVVALARANGSRLATAESCTGGLIAHRFTNVPGSSDIFGYGWVTYANTAKISELGVPPEWLEPASGADSGPDPSRPGAVSEPVARAMAEGALRKSGATFAVAVTGIAGPSGGTPEKPVGTVWIALAHKENPTLAQKYFFNVDRETFKHMASQAALDQLRRALAKI